MCFRVIVFRLKAAYDLGANYTYRVNDDSEMMNPWARKFVDALEVGIKRETIRESFEPPLRESEKGGARTCYLLPFTVNNDKRAYSFFPLQSSIYIPAITDTHSLMKGFHDSNHPAITDTHSLMKGFHDSNHWLVSPLGVVGGSLLL